jgi:hypothetical protein
MTDDPRENTWHPYPEYVSPNYRTPAQRVDISTLREVYQDRYQGRINGEWVDVEQVRVIRQPTNPGAYSIRVSVVTIPEDDGL